MFKTIKVYLASPYSVGDKEKNVRRQIDMADELMNAGFVPFVPLYAHFQHQIHPRTYDEWMRIDFEWVNACDCLLRFGGESKGADDEAEHAIRNDKPVFHSLDHLIKYYDIN